MQGERGGVRRTADRWQPPRVRRAGPPEWLVVVGVVTVVGAIGLAGVLAMSRLGPRHQPAAQTEAEQPPPISAADLLAEFKADPGVAAAKYAGKAVRVKLRVDKSEQTGEDLRVTQRLSDGLLGTYVAADVPVSLGAKTPLGSTVVVRGRVWHSDQSHVQLWECDLE